MRENRVNQSGSVALSAEEVRGPPQRNSLIIMALLTQDYEPGGRGFKSCRARQIIKYLASPARLAFSGCATFARLLIHRNALPSRIRDAQNSACSAALQDQIRLLDQVTDIGAGVMAGHGMMGVAEEGFPIFGRYAGRT